MRPVSITLSGETEPHPLRPGPVSLELPSQGWQGQPLVAADVIHRALTRWEYPVSVSGGGAPDPTAAAELGLSAAFVAALSAGATPPPDLQRIQLPAGEPVMDRVAHVPGEVLRRWCLQHPWQASATLTDDTLAQVLVAMDRLYQARELVGDAQQLVAQGKGETAPENIVRFFGKPALSLVHHTDQFPRRFQGALARGLDTPAALDLLDDLVRSVLRFSRLKQARRRGAALLARVDRSLGMATDLLGLGGGQAERFFDEMRQRRLAARDLTPDWVEQRLERRTQARLEGAYEEADAIRDQLDEIGIIIVDGAGRTRWRIRR